MLLSDKAMWNHTPILWLGVILMLIALGIQWGVTTHESIFGLPACVANPPKCKLDYDKEIYACASFPPTPCNKSAKPLTIEHPSISKLQLAYAGLTK